MSLYPRLSLFTHPAEKASYSGFSTYFPPIRVVRPTPISIPVYVGERQVDLIVFTMVYEQTKLGFGKSKAIVRMQSGPLKGQVLEFHPNKDPEKNIKTCCELIEKRLQEWQERQRHLATQIEKGSAQSERGSIDGSLIKRGNIFFDAVQALLKKEGLGSCEALKRGSKNLGRLSKAITVLNTIGEHAPEGLTVMNFRQGLETVIDVSANLGTSAAAKTLVGYGLVVVGIECPLLAFMITAGSSSVASAAYSSLIRPVVNELGQSFSQFIVQLPAASLAQVREEREFGTQFVDLILGKIGQAFHGCEEQSLIPIEFDITPTIREPLVQRGRIS